MKEQTLTRLRCICFGIGLTIGFSCIYLQEIDPVNDLVYLIMVMVMGGMLLLFSTGFIFIDTEKALDSFQKVDEK